MSAHNVLWQQRHQHFQKAPAQISRFMQISELNELKDQGLIKAFEYTYELAWNRLKEYFEAQREIGIHGNCDANRLHFDAG